MMLISLGDIASVQTATVFRGEAPKPSIKGNVHALTIKDLVGSWPIKPDLLPLITVEDNLIGGCLLGGEVLMPSRGDYYPARLFEGSENPIFPFGQIHIIKPRDSVIAHYLTWILNQPTTQEHIAKLTTGTNIKALTKGNLLSVKVDLPSIEIQRSIEELQSLWGRSRQLREKLSELQEQEIQAACRNLLHTEIKSSNA